MAIELYSSCGSGNNYAAPLLEITITAGKDWQITGGSQRDLAVAQSAAEVAAGGVPLRTQKLGGGASFVPMMDGTAWGIVALFTLVPVSIVLACCPCARRRMDSAWGGKGGRGEEEEAEIQMLKALG